MALLPKECEPTPTGPNKDGISRIDVALRANATKKLRFVWELSAAAKVAGL